MRREELLLESALPAAEEIRCIICGNKVDDPTFQLCDNEECIERFEDVYLQFC